MRSAKELYENNYDFIQDMIKEHKSVDYIATAICEDIPDNELKSEKLLFDVD